MDYCEEVRRRFEAPAGGGAQADLEVGTHSGEAQDRALGVWIRFQIQAAEGRIGTVRFQVFGCPHTIAAVSLVAELIQGQPLTALGSPWATGLAERLQVPEEKIGRLLVLEDALRACA